jgi:two-component system CheB/CheR fusion protein
MRRIQKRMQMLPIVGYNNYSDYLQANPQEFSYLFNLIEINVTSFFRDAQTWDYIATKVIPDIIANKSESEPIRVWSAGCASGEEIYSLAILLAEALGVEQFQARVTIFATDIDDDALQQARRGMYSVYNVANISLNRLKNYFQLADNAYVFHKHLKPKIIFRQHNLIKDAPMSKIDLLMCRNVLIYLNIEAQIRVLARFYFSLIDSGFLCLGKAELLPINGSMPIFNLINHQNHIFNKVPKQNLDQYLLHKALGQLPLN